ncbi:ATP/GTP-binding protein [Spirillospora sp. NPDC048911]|uniref:GTP-binding protein n=1 Tax=Spirillospora sp. NPDC048911 TaxID=3364527 RepID=UPI0037136F72
MTSYERSDGAPAPRAAYKILVAGGFGAGKTTMVGAVSEIRPLQTEESLTEAGIGVDDLTSLERKTTTTVAMDFGRITLGGDLSIYLFGTPGQERFWFMWEELARGALGAVVMVDTRRITASFASIDYFEQRAEPFVIAVNRFDHSIDYTEDEIRTALDVAPAIPIILFDARDRESAKAVLIGLLEHAIRQPREAPARL